jgi:tRNA A-37 threonylcarbamoyl transferase component Bud32
MLIVDHPSEDSILEYLEGRMGAEARARVADHVRGCSECRQLLAEMEEPESGGAYGRYLAVRRIGFGAMAVVYEARDPLLARTVALKVLRSDRATEAVDDELYARLLREAKALARLAHPNVVAVYDVGRAAGRLFLAMEFVEGATLAEWARKELRRWQAIVDLYVQAGRGLAAAHDAGVVHRDFKPANVLVGADGRVCVSDFGLARLTAPIEAEGRAGAEALLDEPVDGLRTRAGTLLGSPAFMSPEQLAGEPADARSDIFSFCVSLWSSLYGERPFAGRTVRELRAAIAEGSTQPSREGIAIPRRLRDVLLRGLKSSPAERPGTMRELLAELEREKAYDGLTRAERILHEAEEFFRPHERARAVSAVAVSLLRGALGGDAAADRPAKSLDRPDLPLVSEVEITGEWLQQFMKTLGPYRSLLSHLFVRAGFVADSDGIVRFEPGAWYPYTLFTLFGYQEEISDDAGFRIAQQFALIMLESEKVPRDLPFGVAAMERADAAFGRGLRIRGRALEHQEPQLRGAGGTRSYTDMGPGRIQAASASPSRCAMSRGYFVGVAEYFGEKATVEHLEGACRDRGATECRYVLSWGVV